MAFKPSIDNRFGETTIQTRSGKKIDAININSINELQDYNADIYFIDEFQFLNGDVYIGDSEYIPVCRNCYNKLNK